MSKMKIGLQVFSVRDVAEKDFKGAMQKVKEIGYDGVELAGLYGLSAEEIRSVLDDIGLEAISAHVGFSDLVRDLDGTVAANKKIGVKFIALPFMGEGDLPMSDNWEKNLAFIMKISEKCKENGITLLYHNHDTEYKKMPDGMYIEDYLFKATGLDAMKPEFDTCWVRVAGEDPVGYIKKYAGYVQVVHLKDFVGSKTANMYELIGTDKKADVTEAFKFRPVGYGVQDFPAIIKASEEVGAEWLIVEQDNSYETPSLEAAKMSRDYLKSIYR